MEPPSKAEQAVRPYSRGCPDLCDEQQNMTTSTGVCRDASAEPPVTNGGSSHAAKLQQELTSLRQSNRDLSSQCAAAAESAAEMTEVIEAAKRKVERQQSKLKSTTTRSQKRCAAP